MRNFLVVTQSISRFFTVERLVHSIMVVFALASVGNVSSYLQAHGHHPLTSYALGVALGGVLVVTAMALADVDYEYERERFWFMVVVVVVIGLLSGTVQTWAYGSHEGMDIASARLMGYGFPVVCEGLLAVYIATYGTTRRRKNIRLATEGTAETVAGAVAEALADVDVTKVRKYVERRVDGLTRAIVDGVIDELMPPKKAQDGRTDVLSTVTDTNTPQTVLDAQRPLEPSHDALDIPVDNSILDTGRRIANDRRNERANARRTQLLQILQREFNGVDSDALNKTELGKRLSTTRQTIGRDLAALEQLGLLSMNGVVRVQST